MKKFVNSYIIHCDSCIRSKPTNQIPIGLLKPTQLPDRPWENITFDLIAGLPELEGFDAILTVVDCHSKMVHYIPTHSDIAAVNIANLFTTYVWNCIDYP